MVETSRIAEIGFLLGEPARTAMLTALMDGRALTAGELAECAGVTPQTASGHIARLAAADLLRVEKQGRHRYHRLASAEVAQIIEGMMQIASRSAPVRRLAVGPRDEALRRARTCYDHLAGRLGVAIADALAAKGAVELETEAGVVTPQGVAFFADIGIDLAAQLGRPKRAVCRPCLDWSERRPHLAGKLGAAICRHFIDRRWVRRIEGTRALRIAPEGRAALQTLFGIREV
jgi:DNA-binding transcriptional ArsR family regulator